MVFNDFDMRQRYRRHPLLSQFSSSLPSNIKELFEWMEFIVNNNPIASAGIKKLSETPVTSFKYLAIDDQNESSSSIDDSWKSILEDSLNLKSKLLSISYNTLLYGNCFVSVYTPIVRLLRCSSCGETKQIRQAKKLKVAIRKKNENNGGFSSYSSYYSNSESSEDESSEGKDITDKYKKVSDKKTALKFVCECSSCNGIKEHTVKDIKFKSKDDINIITWNPNLIKIVSNPISGQSEYYYQIPPEINSGVRSNDTFILSTMPMGMIEASLNKKIFKFADGHIYHAKRETINGISTAWGMPALSSAIPPFLTLMILRKANEKIASDYMVPLRAIFPSQTQSGAGEMYNFIGGSDFVGKINTMLDKWKLDPSAVQTIPFALGTETILGDGKLLMLNQEIDQLESNIASALGIPIEFIKGGLSYTAQGSSLRLLENQLARLSANLEDVIQFIIGRVSVSLDKEPIKVKMVPFKIVDDLQEKAAIMQLASSGQGFISTSTMLEMFNMDSGTEQKRMVADQKSNVKNQLELQRYQQETATSIEERAKAAEQMNNSTFQSINQQALMTEAQQYVEQLIQLDDGARKSQLDEMSKTNYVMYGVVKALLEMQQNKQGYAAAQEAEAQAEGQQPEQGQL